MFCPSCGNEVFTGDRFCKHCGAAQQDAGPPPFAATSPPASETPRPARRKSLLRVIHTSDWQGTCPSCKAVNTSDNYPCPVDRAPVVVAFDDHKLVTYKYPVHAATLRCLNDCGFHADALACFRCGALIMGRNIAFRFRGWPVRTHLLIQIPILLIFIASVVAQLAGVKIPAVTVAFLGSLCVLWYFRPIPRFTFAKVARAAREHAKEEAKKEAIEMAEAVHKGTRHLRGPQ